MARAKLTRMGLTAMTLTLAALLALVWWTGREGPRQETLALRSECESAAADMRSAYGAASDARDKARTAFATMDASRYDLDRLQAALDAMPPDPTPPACDAHPAKDADAARRLTAEYRRLAREWRMAATPRG